MKIHKITTDIVNKWRYIEGHHVEIDLFSFCFYKCNEYEFYVTVLNFEFGFCLQTKEQRKSELKYTKELIKSFDEAMVAVKKRKTTNKKG